MHITKVELENIKSHVDSTFEFSRGTTAITGPNGAGKTTIIEAIAWTLFDLLEYKKEDFVRRGSKKGIARVSFESGLDERIYTVYRDTGTGYYVYDPGIKTRIAEKKDEVRRFLWQHLGVEPGTDLESLFRRAIGVPQGTFTAIFLETAAERKKAFDRLLKVEEYRQGAEKLRETARYIDTSIAAVREKIARAEGELERFESLAADFDACCAEDSDLAARLTNAEADCRTHTDTVTQFEQKEKLFNEAKQKVDSVRAEKLRSEAVLKRLEASVRDARESAEKLSKAKAGHVTHIEALAKIHELERERGEREKLRAQLTEIENAIVNVKADQKRAVERLENALNAHRAIESLRPKAAEQDELEKEIDRLRELEANAKEQQKRIAAAGGLADPASYGLFRQREPDQRTAERFR